jgi:SAM-dependent methyltransferase
LSSGSISYWDSFAKDYNANKQNYDVWVHYYIKCFYNQLVSLALRRLEIRKDFRVLKVDLWNEGIETSRDILGNFAGIDAVGFDLSKTICHLAKERLYNPEIAQATCQNIPFTNAKFDLVLDLSTIDHIPFSKTKEVFAEYYRVLRPKGLVALAFWQWNTATKYFLEIDPIQLYFDKKKVRRALEDVGFEIVDSYDIGALLTLRFGNSLLGQFLFWRLKAAFGDTLSTSATRLEPYFLNWLGGLHVFYAYRP